LILKSSDTIFCYLQQRLKLIMENSHGSANVLPKTYIKCMSNVLARNPPRKPCKNSISTLLPTSNSIQYPQFPDSQLGIFPPTLLHQPAPPSNNTPHQIPCWFEFKSNFFCSFFPFLVGIFANICYRCCRDNMADA